MQAGMTGEEFDCRRPSWIECGHMASSARSQGKRRIAGDGVEAWSMPREGDEVVALLDDEVVPVG